MGQRQGKEAPKGTAWLEFPAKSQTQPMPRAAPTPLPLHRRAPPREPATPQTPKTPQKTRLPTPPPRAKAQRSAKGPAGMGWKARQESAGRSGRETPEGEASFNSPKKPEPIPRRGPRPLPCHAAGVPLPASPRRPDPQGHPGLRLPAPPPPSPDRRPESHRRRGMDVP